jgi:hypothetical protein
MMPGRETGSPASLPEKEGTIMGIITLAIKCMNGRHAGPDPASTFFQWIPAPYRDIMGRALAGMTKVRLFYGRIKKGMADREIAYG